MRKSILESYDKVYIIDLHGSAKKNETSLDGSKDENVFDIQQGVSINIFVKTNEKKNGKLAEVFHCDLYGLRNEKYSNLIQADISSIQWNKLNYKEPNYFFVPKDFSDEESYIKGFKLDEIFIKYVSGFQTKRDKITISISKNELQEVKAVFENSEVDEIRKKFSLPEDGRDWTIVWAKKDLKENKPIATKVMYRPFDDRYTFYTGKSKGFVAYPRSELFNHLNKMENVSLITCRQLSTFNFQHLFASRFVSDMCNISSQTKETGYIFPLYQYQETGGQQTIDKPNKRTPNFNFEIIRDIEAKLGLKFTYEKEAGSNDFAPIDILDYIYAVLHSPTYRKKYKEFLKIDFPRVPHPKDKITFWQLVKMGNELREFHLLECLKVNNFITQYPIDGDNKVTKVKYENGRVYINETQYFDNVPDVSWGFYIGGYQPAQKWLKDRKERVLDFDDILHYQRIIVALKETDRIMKEIDKIEIE